MLDGFCVFQQNMSSSPVAIRTCKSIDGLSAIIAQQFQMDPFQLSLFLFAAVARTSSKALLWQGDGFLLLYKRLEGRLQVAKDT